MKPTVLSISINEVPTTDGSIRAEATMGGRRIIAAAAGPEVLNQMTQQMGMDRESIVAKLQTALTDFISNHLETVTISPPIESPEGSLYFTSFYTLYLRSNDEIQSGIVWYDLPKSMTGPEDLPAIVKNKIRSEVHKSLTAPDSPARKLVEFHGDKAE